MPKPLFALLRHAPTTDDALGVLTAPRDNPRVLPLDESALAQVTDSVRSLMKQTGRAINISASPTERSIVTARNIADMLNGEPTVTTDDRLGNIDQGMVSGTTQENFRKSPLYWRWHHHPATVKFSGGEHLFDVSTRIDSFISERCAEPSIELIISHTTPLQVMMTSLLGLTPGLIWNFYFAYYRITAVYGSTLIAANSLGDIGSWIPQLRE